MSVNTITETLNQTPSVACSGLFDKNGIWNNGFTCPVEHSIQYICCGTNTYRYCCAPTYHSVETKIDIDSNSVDNYASIYDNLLSNDVSSALLNNQLMINKQFEQFQRYFLPVFLLSTTVLFLVGIALWFWLYKHKAFYSLDQDDLTELQTVHSTHINAIPNARNNFNVTRDAIPHSLTHPTTNV